MSQLYMLLNGTRDRIYIEDYTRFICTLDNLANMMMHEDLVDQYWDYLHNCNTFSVSPPDEEGNIAVITVSDDGGRTTEWTLLPVKSFIGAML